MLLTIKKDLFMRKVIALTRVCIKKYLLPAPLEVQWTEVLKKALYFVNLDYNSFRKQN